METQQKQPSKKHVGIRTPQKMKPHLDLSIYMCSPIHAKTYPAYSKETPL